MERAWHKNVGTCWKRKQRLNSYIQQVLVRLKLFALVIFVFNPRLKREVLKVLVSVSVCLWRFQCVFLHESCSNSKKISHMSCRNYESESWATKEADKRRVYVSNMRRRCECCDRRVEKKHKLILQKLKNPDYLFHS